LIDKDTSLLGIVVATNGEVLRINKTLNCIDEIQTMKIPTNVYQAELYNNRLYLLDSYNVFHVVCPYSLKVIQKLDIRVSSPILHFHVHPTLKANDYRFTISFLNNTIHSFTISQTEKIFLDFIRLTVTNKVTKIYSDLYKSILLLDDNSILIIDCKTGEVWHRIDEITDLNYNSRLFATHKIFAIDGTKGINIFKLRDNIKTDDIAEMEQLMLWVSSNIEKKPNSHSYIQTIMKSPVYQPEHLALNWSWSLKSNETNY
jgi:hypothetical protein